MSENQFIFWILAVGVMSCFLGCKHWARVCRKATARRETQRTGVVIDVAPLRPRLEELRRNYAAAAHAHARGIRTREGLVAGARRRMEQLPFFRLHPAATHEGEEHVG